MECRSSFIRKKSRKITFGDFINFYSLIKGKQNKEGLSEKTHLSRTTLWRRFTPFFSYLISPDKINQLFPVIPFLCRKPWVLGLDGKWLRRLGVVMIYRDVTDGINLYWSCHPSESYEAIRKDLDGLYPVVENNLPDGLISDWKNSIVASIEAYFPDAAYQRCLSHLKRQFSRLLPLRSPYVATQDLRKVALEMTHISDPSDFYDWSDKLSSWIEKYSLFLKERTIGVGTRKKWWYTHGNLRRAIRVLTQKHEYTFAYLKNPFLPKTNNSLEGTNSQIDTKLGIHRGMKFNQQVSFIFWLLTFSRIKNQSDPKKLWDSLKNEIFAG